MYNFLSQAHSICAYIALISLIIAVVNGFIGATSKRAFTINDRRVSLFALIGSHIQLVLGMFLYFSSPSGFDKIQSIALSALSSAERLLVLEHPLINILAIILITVGWSRHKKSSPEKKFKAIAFFYTAGLVLILSRIPWSLWFA